MIHIYLEANFVVNTIWPLDDDHKHCRVMLDLFKAGRIRIAIPETSFVEAKTVIPEKIRRGSQVIKAFRRVHSHLRYAFSTSYSFAEVGKFLTDYANFLQDFRRTWIDKLGRLAEEIQEIMPVTNATLVELAKIRADKSLNLDHNDALVLAAVACDSASRMGDDLYFVTRDTDFGGDPIKDYCSDRNIQIYTSFVPMIETLKDHVGLP